MCLTAYVQTAASLISVTSVCKYSILWAGGQAGGGAASFFPSLAPFLPYPIFLHSPSISLSYPFSLSSLYSVYSEGEGKGEAFPSITFSISPFSPDYTTDSLPNLSFVKLATMWPLWSYEVMTLINPGFVWSSAVKIADSRVDQFAQNLVTALFVCNLK